VKVTLARGGMRPRLLAEVERQGDESELRLLVAYDTSNNDVLRWFAETLDEVELEQVRAALDLGPDGAA
jgi:hypothetical protein